MKKLKIGNIVLDSPVILAPMAGVTNQAFKSVVRSIGAGLICTEMVNDRALLSKNERTLEMIKIGEMEHPVALQLFGNSPETMSQAAKYLDEYSDCDIIDLNFGCPAPKITKSESGSKILLNPELLFEIVSSVVSIVRKPVMVKMRIGWDANSVNVIKNAINAQNAGASAITIHGRTTKQHYSGLADWNIIKEVKKAVSIPVIGNGDIDSPQKALEMLEFSKVDGIMIGRAAMGNPWIFKSINQFLETGELIEEPSVSEKIKVCKKHLDILMSMKPEKVAVMEMRGHGSHYIKGLKNATYYKKKLQKTSTYKEMMDTLNKIEYASLGGYDE